MNYNEFISISKESTNDITYEVYRKEIEPCYNIMPEINVANFVEWWKKNRNLAAWISGLVTANANYAGKITVLEKQIAELEEVKNKVDDENDKFTIALEKKNEYIDNLRNAALNDRSNLLDKIQELKLKIAFTPEKVTKEIRNEFFDTYDEKKQDALKRGIITE